MNKYRILFAALFISATIVVSGCHIKQKSIDEMAFKAKKDGILERYNKIPHDEVLQQMAGNRLYGELEDAYKNSLITLKTEADYDCAKMAVVIVTAETGKSITLANTYGIPYIAKICDNASIDFYDLTPAYEGKDISTLSQMPEDGGWTKTGAALLADQLAIIITKYDTVRSSKDPSTAKKPATFGDLTPKQDEVLDGDRNLPYHLKVNSQGLRMDHELTFPKRKQTILILGDGQLYNPYLDNEFIATELLQKRFPDKEIINAAALNYTIDDYQTLYREKARFTEPDVILVCTNGGDILDMYFTQRNRYSRARKIYPGSEVERSFYRQLYNTNQ